MREIVINNGNDPIKKEFSEEKLRTLILKKIRSIFIPSSVYRIQLNSEYTFKHAEKLVPYLKELGFEAVYCSPYFQSVPGSMHGYNITDPNRINQEIGSWEDYVKFCDALTQNSIGHIADIVPNHMGIAGNNNSWWQDILENGQSSLYSDYFDISWKPAKQELSGKVLLPVLGNFYGRVLENREIQLKYQKGGFFVTYFEHEFPIDPKTYPIILEDSEKNLQKKMGKNNPDYLELLSIITAFRNLPSNTESIPEKKMERSREKEITKQRLARLSERSEDIRGFIDNCILNLNGNKDTPESFDRIDSLLDLQAYRLAYWSVAAQEINYRRFFNINELAAIRIEDEEVFRHYHELLFTLIKEGKINGLRIDHTDGLYDPPVYFRRLQREYLLQVVVKEFSDSSGSQGESEQIDMDAVRSALETLLADEFVSSPAFYVVAEKILEHNEFLPENWIIHGTVGYDYLNALNGIFVDRRNDIQFSELYEDFIGYRIDFEDLVYDKKKSFGLVPMASEINALGQRLNLISETNRNFRDFTRNDLITAIRAVIAGFPVYRTYVAPEGVNISERDEKDIRAAVAKAVQKTPILNSAVFEFLQDALLLRLTIEAGSEEMKQYKDFLLRFQQLTGPIMAKGVEDTSFYIYNRLVSLNEVGGDPFYFGCTIKDFHAQNLSRNKRWPGSMLATSTHDTKRSEDVRMRINFLSEIPGEWKSRIREWSAFNREYKTMINGVAEPRANTEYFIYQTLIGIWPDEPLTPETRGPFIARILKYMLKSIREAKIFTNWTTSDVEYEKAVEKFTGSILVPDANNSFLKNFTDFQRKISFFGKLNSLSATVLKTGCPGVVDVYQGNETWNYCLVDPDNRQQVDFEFRWRLLNMIKGKTASKNSDLHSLCAINQENMNHLKFLYTMKGILFRRKNKEMFTAGEYIPVHVTGTRENNVVAFICKYGKNISITAAGRFFSDWNIDETYTYNPDFWGNTELILPKGMEFPSDLKDVITSDVIGIKMKDQTAVIRVSDLFQTTCACILTNTGDENNEVS